MCCPLLRSVTCISVFFQEYGFTREQSSNALIIHGTVKKALEVLHVLPGERFLKNHLNHIVADEH